MFDGSLPSRYGNSASRLASLALASMSFCQQAAAPPRSTAPASTRCFIISKLGGGILHGGFSHLDGVILRRDLRRPAGGRRSTRPPPRPTWPGPAARRGCRTAPSPASPPASISPAHPSPCPCRPPPEARAAAHQATATPSSGPARADASTMLFRIDFLLLASFLHDHEQVIIVGRNGEVLVRRAVQLWPWAGRRRVISAPILVGGLTIKVGPRLVGVERLPFQRRRRRSGRHPAEQARPAPAEGPKRGRRRLRFTISTIWVWRSGARTW